MVEPIRSPRRSQHDRAAADPRGDVSVRSSRTPEGASTRVRSGTGHGGHRIRVNIDESRIDPDVLRVVRRLIRHGHEAYIVGGGVRDLLLGCRPKDFDVATGARPEEVRRLFRNSRIIGRRFRLVHVLFAAGKVIEVATFRRGQEGLAEEGAEEPVLIRSDNVYGQAHEDAVRRDLTINGLLYDVETHEVLDFVGGMSDIRRRVVQTIGDPRTRFLEDPVRMLRAIKFAARLDLGMVPEVYDATVLVRGSLSMVSRSRLFEELLKLMRCGACHRAMWLMWETGLLQVVLPEVASLLDDGPQTAGAAARFWRMLTEVDNLTRSHGAPLGDMALMTVLLLEPLYEAMEGEDDRVLAALECAEPVFQRLAMPRRIVDGVCRIAAMMPNMPTRGKRRGRLTKTELSVAALDVHAVVQASRDEQVGDGATGAGQG